MSGEAAGDLTAAAVPLLSVTDEELDALTSDQGVVVLPHLSGLDPAARRLARETARRSLRSRSLLDDDGRPAGLLATVLELRAGAPVVLVLQRQVGPPPGGTPSAAVRYLHVIGDLAVLEDVDPHGRHALALADRPAWEGTIRDFLVPPDAAPGAGEGDPGTTLRFGAQAGARQVLADLAHPTVLGDAHVLAAREALTWSALLALGPGGCWAAQERRGSAAHEWVPVRPEDVVALVLERLVHAVRDGADESADESADEDAEEGAERAQETAAAG